MNDDPDMWVSSRQFADIYKRSHRRIQQMCKSGEILDFCVSSYQDIRGRWWLRLSSAK